MADVAQELAIDLGTVRCRMVSREQGLLVDQPTVVAIDGRTRAVVAIGTQAQQMIGATIKPTRAAAPIVEGALADYDVAVRMLRYLFRVGGGGRFGRPKVLLGVPGTATSIERRAIGKAAVEAGASSVHLVPQPIAAALELGLPIDQPVGSMVCDFGGGKSEMAVLSLGGIVGLHGLRLGGRSLDDAIAAYVRTTYGVVVPRHLVNEVKEQVASATVDGDARSYAFLGRAAATGEPEEVVLSTAELQACIDDLIRQITDATVQCLADAPPEMSQDIIFQGMHLLGGASQLRGFAERLAAATDVPVHVHEDPSGIVVAGLRRCFSLRGRMAEVLQKV
jgi:rod shape-determining protein MreB